jgi:tetratricopeptide (TPR) repeat protein
VNAPDAHVEHIHPFGHAFVGQAMRRDNAEAVVATQDISDSGNENPHARRMTEIHVATTEDAIRELERRLDGYPPDRYPVQHATVLFHLGIALTKTERLGEAETALRNAVRLLDPGKLPVEHAKALVALGAVLRSVGDIDSAAKCFARAAELFSTEDAPLEEGAAWFNLGLVRLSAGNGEAASESWRRARELLDPERVPAQASAAARELGGLLLREGRVDDARTQLEDAVALAVRGRDVTALGAAANALGLARLAAGDAAGAALSFRDAVEANPRGIRPESFAMAQANLAVAFERVEDRPRARIAARQALAVETAPTAVTEQAVGVIRRLGSPPGDVVAVLDTEPPEMRPAVMREELIRWAAESAEERTDEAGAWIDAQVARDDGPELAELWLGALLELPTDAMESIIRAALASLAARDPDTGERFRSQTSAAMVRFHVPQWTRLKSSFNRIAIDLGQERVWD